MPPTDDPSVSALMPGESDLVLIAQDEYGRSGAAWCYYHDTPLVTASNGKPLPELVIAVVESARGHGIGTALIEEISELARERYPGLPLNVHILNPAVHLYVRTGFRVAGAGRGWFGVAMVR